MPRSARAKSKSGIYHIILRGINRQDIFHEEEDYQRFLETVARIKSPNAFELYGYCLMGNHVHLLLQEQEDEIAKIMKRLGTSYAWWYNSKYDRVGHLFQDRFKSEPVEDDNYLISVLRYIHNNPVKAQLVLEPEQYNWSSCSAYYRAEEYSNELINTTFILRILSSEEKGNNTFKKFMQEINSDEILDIEKKARKSDDELYAEIQEILKGQPITILQTMDKHSRDKILQQIKEIEGATQRQIARVMGIKPSTVFKA